jgi:thiamine-phosphate pyrophosphorylase
MVLKESLLRESKVYAIINVGKENARDILLRVGLFLREGVGVIQLRDKVSSASDFFHIAQQCRRIIARKALFIVNDRIDIAYAAGADGVHLGQEDVPCRAARYLVKNRLLIGVSASTPAQAAHAEREGADYIGIGPVFNTPYKSHVSPLGAAYARRIKNAVSIPAVAIGGITPARAAVLAHYGFERIACISCLEGKRSSVRATIRKFNAVLM